MALRLIKNIGYIDGKRGGKQKRKYGLYKCDCGNIVEVLQYAVKSGAQSFCGCKLSPSLQEKFDEFTQPVTESGCLIWTGNINSKGYGVVSINSKAHRAHRVAYEKNIGEIPKGLHVLHKCDVRCCVNPNHLFLGTNFDNVQDRVNKKRSGTRYKKAVIGY